MGWKERGLRITLLFLPILIILGSAFLPLYKNDFDWQKSTIDLDQLEKVAGKFQPSQVSEDIIEIGDLDVNGGKTILTLYIQSPFKTEMVVKNFSIEVLSNDGPNRLELEKEVTLDPGEKKEVHLIGDGIQHSTGTRFGEMNVEMELLGITMEMER